MSDNEKFQIATSLDKTAEIAASQDIIERVTRILFVLFMPDDRPMSDPEIDELLVECFDMGSLLMAVIGMNIIGKNSDGDYVARFRPHKSLSDFAQENGV